MKLFVISDNKYNKREREIVLELFKKGLDYYHLRKSRWSNSKIKKFIEYFPIQYRNKIIIHSSHYLANKIEIGGIHFNRQQRRSIFTPLRLKLFKFSRPDLIYSTSLNGINGSNWIPDSISYVFLSNVFEGITMKSSKPYYSKEAVKEFVDKTNAKVVVLGGVDINNINEIKEMGFYGCALLGALWKSKNPVEKFEKIKALCA